MLSGQSAVTKLCPPQPENNCMDRVLKLHRTRAACVRHEFGREASPTKRRYWQLSSVYGYVTRLTVRR